MLFSEIFAYTGFSPRLSPKWFKNATKRICVYSTEGQKNTPEDLGRVVAFLFFVSITLFLEIMSRISNYF